jgi:hypothetical protein
LYEEADSYISKALKECKKYDFAIYRVDYVSLYLYKAQACSVSNDVSSALDYIEKALKAADTKEKRDYVENVKMNLIEALLNVK